MAKLFRNKIIFKILNYYKDIWALGYVSSIAHWDLETYMPPKGAGFRGEALGRISVIRQKLFLDPAFANLLASAGKKKLNDYERGVVRVLLRALRYYEKLPPEFVEKFEKLTNTATVVWRKAKEENKFDLFAPYLIRIFGMNRQMAEYLGYKDSPYDALLDQFEEGLTSKEVEAFFGQIKPGLIELLAKIKKSPRYQARHPLEKAKYVTSQMRLLNQKILKLFWDDGGRFRLDESAHPFTTSFSNQDTRITTWYHKTDFARTVLATIHEFGHALYDLQSADELEMTPIGGGTSLVLHESQSRFWENFVGRSEHFIQKFLPDMRKAVGRSLSAEDVYAYFNNVSPGSLRVEADEITYHFHIMLRYEIEKAMIESRIKNYELRDIWNSKMKEYLGVTPKNDSEGILQDIHWSGGAVGYFPTYSLGTSLGAQWDNQIKNQISKSKSYGEIEKWLKEHVHKFGSTYTMQELLKKNKMKFDPHVNLEYLKKKYSKIYRLSF